MDAPIRRSVADYDDIILSRGPIVWVMMLSSSLPRHVYSFQDLLVSGRINNYTIPLITTPMLLIEEKSIRANVNVTWYLLEVCRRREMENELTWYASL